MQPAENAPLKRAEPEIFELFMAPQAGNLNSFGWARIEGAVRDLVRATDGKATIVTGVLSRDAQGNVIPPPSTIGADKIGVPTEFYMAVKLDSPDGTTQVFAIRAPNSQNCPTLNDDTTLPNGTVQHGVRYLVQNWESDGGWRVPFGELEQETGLTMFPDLSAADRAKWEGPQSDTTKNLTFPDPLNHKAALLLFPNQPGVSSSQVLNALGQP
jgi:DNA/RNA endonuclease G (NUC1)